MLEQIISADFLVLQLMQTFQQPILNILFEIISFIGSPIFWFGIAAYYYWSNREEDAFYLITLIALVGIITDALKFTLKRPRPSADEFNIIKNKLSVIEQNYGSIYSFPSGHSAMIGAVTSYFFSCARKLKKIILIILLITVPISRIYLGMHFLSDVIAGVLLGLGIGKMTDYLRDKTENKKINFSRKKTRIWLSIVFLIGLALLMLGSYSLGFVLLGFYFGMFLMKTFRLDREMNELNANITGFGGLFILTFVIFIFSSNQVIEQMLFFIVGAWISFLNPMMNQKLFGKK